MRCPYATRGKTKQGDDGEGDTDESEEEVTPPVKKKGTRKGAEPSVRFKKPPRSQPPSRKAKVTKKAREEYEEEEDEDEEDEEMVEQKPKPRPKRARTQVKQSKHQFCAYL